MIIMTIHLAIKRIFDVTASLSILMIGFPVFVLIGILVKLTSPGPIFFVQERVGREEHVFQLIKFRTMTGSPDRNSLVWTEADEARITPIGQLLRDYGFDELPQVINILRGDMSVIGPRPPLPSQVVAYSDKQRAVFGMRPGVLSLAAIKGRRSIPMDRRIDYHVEYVENWSVTAGCRDSAAVIFCCSWQTGRRRDKV